MSVLPPPEKLDYAIWIRDEYRKYKEACAKDGCNGDVLLMHPDRLKELLEKRK